MEIEEMERKWAGWRLVLIGAGPVGQDQTWWGLMVVLGGEVGLVGDCLWSTVLKGGGEESLTCKEKSIKRIEIPRREKRLEETQPVGWRGRLLSLLESFARH